MRKYRIAGPLRVLGYEPGEEFEHELEPAEEAALLDAGRIEIVPRPYKVIADRQVHETEPGGIFELGLPLPQEAALIEGGHIELCEPPKKRQRKGAT